MLDEEGGLHPQDGEDAAVEVQGSGCAFELGLAKDAGAANAE